MAIEFFWTEANIEHIAEHDLTPQDIENAYATAKRFTTSRSSGRPAFFGLDRDDNTIFVVYEEIDTTTWYVVTAYPI